MPAGSAADVRDLTLDDLRAHPLPVLDRNSDKESRGRVLVVGGSAETPGAVILAGIAALRAGAGKLQIATTRSTAAVVAAAVPEAGVVGLPERSGLLFGDAAAQAAALAEGARTILLGPGLQGVEEVQSLVRDLLPRLDGPTLVLDAAAVYPLADAPGLLGSVGARSIATPNAREMAGLLGIEVEAVEADLAGAARAAQERFGLGAVVVETVAGGGELYRSQVGGPGLATSGSGDVLAGIVAGLSARGAEATTAALWGLHLHGSAGDRLAERIGPLGFLARELLDEVPQALNAVG